MAGKVRRASHQAAPSWTDDEVVGVLTAEMLLSGAVRAVPGFEAVRELAGEYEQARAGYITAVSERYPTVDRKRSALRRVAARIVVTPIDWQKVVDQIERARAGGLARDPEPETPATKRPDNVIDLMEAMKRSLERHRKARA